MSRRAFYKKLGATALSSTILVNGISQEAMASPYLDSKPVVETVQVKQQRVDAMAEFEAYDKLIDNYS